MLRAGQLGTATLGAICLAMSALVACAPASPPSPMPTATARSRLSRPTQVDFVLPAPLHFLRGWQIWRVTRDCATLHEVTHEPTPVTDFDVSPADGALVYVTDNQLIHTDERGENRQALVVGPSLPPVDGYLTSLNDRSHISGRVATPRWSLDGERIGYVHNGLKVISLPSSEVQSLRPNDPVPERSPEQRDEGYEGPLLFMSVVAWSPNSLHLLAEAYRYPLSSLYDRLVTVKTLAEGRLPLFSCGPCHFVWSADSQYFYMANPSEGGSAALMRYAMEAGQSTHRGLDVPARSAYFYAYPHLPNPDQVYYFMATTPDPWEPPEAFRMYRGPAAGWGGPALLREDRWPIETALWARDGSGALVATSSAANRVPADTLVWLPVDGGPAIALPIRGARRLRWGVESQDMPHRDVSGCVRREDLARP